MKNYVQSTAEILTIALVALALAASSLPLLAQEHTPDQHTLLLLHFNDDLNGAQGDTPTQAQGVTFEPGIFGNGAYFAPGNQVYFPSAGNINSLEGTLEFWIKPRWNGNDGQNHVVLRYGNEGGVLFFKDGGNYWRSIFNRYGFYNPEIGTGLYVGTEWQANEWHHCAFTWNSTVLNLYVDGELRAVRETSWALNVVNEATFQLGAEFNYYNLDAVIDELRISAIERSPQEIEVSFLAGLGVSSLQIQPSPIILSVAEEMTPTLIAETNLGTRTIAPEAAEWRSTKPKVARVDRNGKITALAPGYAKITVRFNGAKAQALILVRPQLLTSRNAEVDQPSLNEFGSFALHAAESAFAVEATPTAYELAQNYPNPFNPETEIHFALPQTEHVVIKIFSLRGEEVRTLVNEERAAGFHAVRWEGKDRNGNPAASGVYLCQLQAGGFSQVRKMSLLR